MPSTRNASRLIVLLAALVLAVPLFAGVSSERLVRLDHFLDAYVAEGKLPGAVLQVTDDGRTVYHRAAGYRDRETDAAMQPDTIFRIASMSKAVVSAAVMMLQERGALLITQPVGDFLPEYAATTVAVAQDGGGYEVADAASGQPLDAFLETEIFEPLGMKDTSFYVPPDKSDRLAVVYSRTRDGALERPGEVRSTAKATTWMGRGRVSPAALACYPPRPTTRDSSNQSGVADRFPLANPWN